MPYKVSAAELSVVTLNESEYVKSVLQNISNILKTRRGSVPHFREFGLPMEFVDQPMSIAEPTMIIEVREALTRFEPRAELVSISFTSNKDGQLFPVVEVNIKVETL